MKQEVQPFAIAGADTTGGTAILCENFEMKTVSLGGTFTGSFKFQGSMDGTTWHDVSGALTAAALLTVADTNGAEFALKFIRLYRTSLASGTPVAYLAGKHSRSDV